MKEVTAIVRTECVPELIRALKGSEVSRLSLSRIHAVGAGVDPEDFRLSLEEGGVYTEKTKVESFARRRGRRNSWTSCETGLAPATGETGW